MRFRLLAFWVLLATACCAATGRAQLHEGRTLVEARLVADRSTAVPGETVRVGLHLRQAPGWHTYWQNPGDSGMATRIRWTLPPGAEAGPIEWPTPRRIVEPGDLEVYGYKEEVLLVSPIRVPSGQPAGEFVLKADVSWLVCEAICIPGSAALELRLPVAADAAPVESSLFDRFRARLPSREAVPFAHRWSRDGAALVLRVEGVPEGDRIEFFPLPGERLVEGHPVIAREEGDWVVRVPMGSVEGEDHLPGVLKQLRADGSEVAWEMGDARAVVTASALVPAPPRGAHGLLRYLLYGFLGGLLMNVMPCVLPVIALKIYGFLEQAGHSRQRVFGLGLAFTGGVFAWFLGLAALIVGFQAAGSSLNWSFQFQHPPFVAAMLLICLVFGLNLVGAFELVLPARAGSWLDRVTGHGGMGARLSTGCSPRCWGRRAPLLSSRRPSGSRFPKARPSCLRSSRPQPPGWRFRTSC